MTLKVVATDAVDRDTGASVPSTKTTISGVIGEGPAWAARVKPHDEVVSVNGVHVKGLTQKELDELVRSEKRNSLETGGGMQFVFHGTCEGSRRGNAGVPIAFVLARKLREHYEESGAL